MGMHWMRFILTFWVVAAVVLCTDSAYLANAQHQLFVPANDISFLIRCERKTYKLGDQVEFTYKVTNVSRGAVFVPQGVWDVKCAPHLWAWFEDASGKHFIPGYLVSCLGPNRTPINERMKKEAVLLRPGEVHRGSFTLETKTFKNELKPGTYRIEAALFGWRDDQFDAGEKSALETMRHPFMRGEVPASTTVELTAPIHSRIAR
jgi:hypothetical protein